MYKLLLTSSGFENAKEKTKYPVIPLTDSQALFIIDENITIIE